MSHTLAELWSLVKGGLVTLCTYMAAQLYPIHDFLRVIMVLATLNLIFGWYADTIGWSFKKAFKAFIYLIGYFGLLVLIHMLGTWMHLEQASVEETTSWVTWVMFYFYATNIFRNWHSKQPDNKPIEFIYWVLTFKIFEKIKYMKDFKEYQEQNKKKNE